MATYVVTIPDGEELNCNPAPSSRKVLLALAAGIMGEDVSGHCLYDAHDAYTGDDDAMHYRLGLVVRRIS